jgi:hypothetical protein
MTSLKERHTADIPIIVKDELSWKGRGQKFFQG